MAAQSIEQGHFNFIFTSAKTSLKLGETALRQPTVTARNWQKKIGVERDALLESLQRLTLAN